MTAARAILALEQARLQLWRGLPPARAATLALEPGDFALIDAADETACRSFADAVTGLAAPAAGRVLFMGRDWAQAGPDDANAMRGRIGRLAAAGSWIESLPIEDNILIQQVHHTHREAQALRADAARLGRQFGLPGLPLGRPADLFETDLRRAALVRLFLGRPRLVVIEHQPHLADDDHVAPLVNAARIVRDRGGAVLWLTLDPRAWRDASLPVTRRLRIIAGEIREGTGPG